MFANPDLRRLNLAFAGSNIGDWAFAVALSLYAFERGGPTALGVVGVVRYLSMSLLGPVMSTFADRYRRARVMVTADLVRMVLVAAAAVLVALGAPSLSVYALAILTAVVGTAFRPAQAALLPSLAADPAELSAANAVSSTIESLGFFVGPALAALLLAVSDIPTVFAVDAVTFAWSAVFVFRLPSDVPEDRTADERSHLVADLGAGFRAIAADRDLRTLVGMFFCQTVLAGASLVFTVAVALQLLGLGRPAVGLLDAMTGIGGIVGGFLALSMARRKRLSFDFGLGVLLWAAPLLVLAAWPSTAAAIGVMILVGIGNSLVDVNGFTVLQRIVPDAVMGRVFGAVESVLIGGMALGALLMPLLMATVGLRTGLAVLGATVTALVLAGMSRLTRIDATTLAPPHLPLVAACEILSPLSESVQEELARSLVEIHVPPGGLVVVEGEDGDLFYLIGRGTAEVLVGGEVVNHLGPGDGFGEIALLRDMPRVATVRAVEGLTLYALEREVFLAAVTGDGEAAALADVVVTRFLAA